MLGHQVARTFASNFETWATLRSRGDLAFAKQHLPNVSLYPSVEANQIETVFRAIDEIQPDLIINCVGIIKQDALAYDPISSIRVNALLPHEIDQLAQFTACRVIHISTDCVFDGQRGNYCESDTPNATDLYGRTKQMGELCESMSLTLRTSIIGPELKSTRSLLDWFCAQTGTVDGYTKAIFSGLTTLELSRVILKVATDFSNMRGLYHVSGKPISKFDLLSLVRDEFHLDIAIQPVVVPAIDRSLNSNRFQTATGYRPPSWEQMIRELSEHYRSEVHGGSHALA